MSEIFIRKHEYELGPGCIRNTMMHTVIMAFLFQTNDFKIFNANDIKDIDIDPR